MPLLSVACIAGRISGSCQYLLYIGASSAILRTTSSVIFEARVDEQSIEGEDLSRRDAGRMADCHYGIRRRGRFIPRADLKYRHRPKAPPDTSVFSSSSSSFQPSLFLLFPSGRDARYRRHVLLACFCSVTVCDAFLLELCLPAGHSARKPRHVSVSACSVRVRRELMTKMTFSLRP